MKQRLYLTPFILILIMVLTNCAKKGTPSGGALDSIPPVIVKSVPENFSTNFTDKEIRIYFDEYIKLKELQKNLIVSPPLKYNPIITPLSTSKMLKIKILDTLQENTTYSFNFGKSIVDNNEENEFQYFKYVFSTGSYIDSLVVSGQVMDALLPKAENPVTVMLYEVKENFNDSVIYTQKPTYITVTRDSSNTFEITNVKQGKYLLMALKEKNFDFTFQPKTDKIGFANEYVTLPTDSSYSLTLFKEFPDFQWARPSQLSKYHIVFGYTGEGKELEIQPISEVPQDFTSLVIRDHERDSLHYWFKPEITSDSLMFLAKNKSLTDSLEVRMKKLFPDSLLITQFKSGTLIPRDTMKLRSSTPLVAFDKEKISVIDKDSVMVDFSVRIDSIFNLVELSFTKTEDQRYKVTMLPGSFTDFYDAKSDSLAYVVQTNATSDYGTLSLTLQNVRSYPIIVELVNDKFAITASKVIDDDREAYFDYIKPGNYFVRIIYDENANSRWDTGSFLQRRQPENVIFYPVMLEIRPNWSLKEIFRID